MAMHVLQWIAKAPAKDLTAEHLVTGRRPTLETETFQACLGESCSQFGAVGGRGQAVDLTTEHRVTGSGPTVEAEVHRVESVGGWIEDGRVCDVIAVSRAFGDAQFKGDGPKDMLQQGVRCAPCEPGMAFMLPSLTTSRACAGLPCLALFCACSFATVFLSSSGLPMSMYDMSTNCVGLQ